MIRDHMSPGLPSANPGLLQNISLAASFENAARLGQLCLVEAMLVDGIDINEPDIKGRTMLHWAARNGHREVAELLVKCGAETGREDLKGRTALDYAREMGYPSLCDLLGDRPE